MSRTRCFVTALLVAGLPSAAQARFHEWNVDEVFSNADGSVQFVEFTTGTDFQDLIGDHAAEFRASNAILGSAPFGTDLDTIETGGHSLLIATPGFLAAAGIEPDYEMPAGSIPVETVDAVRMSGSAPTQLDFVAGTLPTDGSNSINRVGGIAAATPTNFADETGTIVPEPGAAAMALTALGALLVASRQR